MKTLTIFAGITLCLINVPNIYAVHIRLFTEYGFKGLKYESYNGQQCVNIYGRARPTIASLATDTCVIVYGHSDCQGAWSKKFTFTINFPNKWHIGSFRACNNEEGGPQLNVDILKYWNAAISKAPPTIERYRNVCSCVNVPTSILQLDRWSINNHGNELLAYSEPNCLTTTWKARRIPAGSDADSRDMNYYTSKDHPIATRTKSFGPDPRSTYYRQNCLLQLLNLKQQKELLRQKLLTQYKINKLSNMG